MCADMRTDMCADMCTHRCVGLCEACAYVCVDTCADMYVAVCADARTWARPCNEGGHVECFEAGIIAYSLLRHMSHYNFFFMTIDGM